MFSYKGIKDIRIIAGPCSAETREQLFSTAEELHRIGINILRAGIWKPRTHAHTFEGVGEIGLGWLREVQKELGMKVSTEVGNVKHIELALKYGIDIIWIGARTTVNPFLMQELADALRGVDIPVMVKNPVCPDIELWAGGIERLQDSGIRKLSLIHRGFSLLDNSPYRNSPCLDLGMSMKKRFPEIPVYCDPSHICGKRELLADLSAEALEAGMDGLMIESHCHPENAWSDARQQLTPAALAKMLSELGIQKHSEAGYQFNAIGKPCILPI